MTPHNGPQDTHVSLRSRRGTRSVRILTATFPMSATSNTTTTTTNSIGPLLLQLQLLPLPATTTAYHTNISTTGTHIQQPNEERWWIVASTGREGEEKRKLRHTTALRQRPPSPNGACAGEDLLTSRWRLT